jgi:hypothetical protein
MVSVVIAGQPCARLTAGNGRNGRCAVARYQHVVAGARCRGEALAIPVAIRGTPVSVARGHTVDIDIRAEAEVVIEGCLLPHGRRPEGPLADFHGYYGALWESPVFEVTAIRFSQQGYS